MTTDAKHHQDFSDSNTPSKPAGILGMKVSLDALRGKFSLSMIGLLLVEMIIRYEWFSRDVSQHF